MDTNLLENAKNFARDRLEKGRYQPTDIPDINGVKPDVYGVRKLPGRRVMKAVIKVETEDSWTGDGARQCMAAFSEWSGKFKSRTAMLFVPEGCGRKAREELPDYDEYYEFKV